MSYTLRSYETEMVLSILSSLLLVWLGQQAFAPFLFSSSS